MNIIVAVHDAQRSVDICAYNIEASNGRKTQRYQHRSDDNDARTIVSHVLQGGITRGDQRYCLKAEYARTNYNERFHNASSRRQNKFLNGNNVNYISTLHTEQILLYI